MARGEQFPVSIIVGVVDQASMPLRHMSLGAGTAFSGIARQGVGALASLSNPITAVVAGIGAITAAATAAGVAFTAFVVKATREAIEFEAVLKDVELQSGATAEEMRRIRESALDPEFARMGRAGTDLANVYKRLAAEGLAVTQQMEVARPAVELAIVLGQEEAEATKLLLNLREQYNLSWAKTAHIADIATNALANTSFQGDELAETMKYAGLMGSMLNWTLEETVAAADAIIKPIGDASMAGTAFRAMVTGLLDPTDEMIREFEGVGISAEQLAAALKDPLSLIQLLQTAQARGVNLATIFDTRALMAAQALIQADSREMSRLVDVLGEAGTAQEFVSEKMSTAEGVLQRLGASWQNFLTAAGTNVTPVLEMLIPPFQEILALGADWIGRLAAMWTELARSEEGQQAIEGLKQSIKDALPEGQEMKDLAIDIAHAFTAIANAVAALVEWMAKVDWQKVGRAASLGAKIAPSLVSPVAGVGWALGKPAFEAAFMEGEGVGLETILGPRAYQRGSVINQTINVRGSVVAENDLRQISRDELTKAARGAGY